jgi:hypothetical protein
MKRKNQLLKDVDKQMIAQSNNHVLTQYLKLAKGFSVRLRPIHAVCLCLAFSSSSHAEFVTHPLGEASTAPAPETPKPATPEATGDQPPIDPETYFKEEFGDKKLGTCTMTYKLEGFSLAYKQYDGTGEVSCRNGQKAKVKLSSKSIGFSIGYSVIEGEGFFTDVKHISEVYGNYISFGNHFGFKNSVDRQILTRGEISLALRGKGKGFDIGVTIGDLSIQPR